MEGGNGRVLRYVKIDEMHCLDKIMVRQWMYFAGVATFVHLGDGRWKWM